MLKVLCPVLFFWYLNNLGAQNIHSQEVPGSWQYIYYHSGNNQMSLAGMDTFAMENRLYQIDKKTIYSKEKHKHTYWEYRYTFDNYGRMVNLTGTYDTGYKAKIVVSAVRIFNQNGIMTQNSYHVNSKGSYFHFLQLNDSNKVVSDAYFNHKYRFSGRIQTDYNEQGKKASVIYRNQKDGIKQRYRYTYFSNGQLKQIVLSGRKGKIIRVTDYSCDKSGESIKNNKDTIRVCSLKSYLPDGSVITTTQTFNYKGEPYKTVEVKNAQGLVIKYDLYFGIKEELLYSHLYEYKEGKLIKHEFTNSLKKNHPFSRITVYDANDRIVKDESVVKISKTKTRIKRNDFLYDDKGMIINEKGYENGKLMNEIRYTYLFYK